MIDRVCTLNQALLPSGSVIKRVFESYTISVPQLRQNSTCIS